MTMPVTPTTTFSNIMAQFQPTEGNRDHHVRFQEGKGLYTSGRFSTAKMVDFLTRSNTRMEAREAKRLDGATQIKQAIDREYGPGYGDRIFLRLHQQNPGLDLSQGVRRSDLTRIQDAIQSDQAIRNGPRGLTISENGTVTGHDTVTHTSDTPSQTIENAIRDKGHFYLGRDKLTEVGGLMISDKAKSDLPRMHVLIPRGDGTTFDTYQQPIEDTVRELRAFAGNDRAVTVLGGLLHQYSLRVLHSHVQRQDGEHLDLGLANSHQEATMKGPDDQLIPVGQPKQYAGAQITLSKTDLDNYRIGIDWPLYFTGFRTREGTTQMPLHEGGVLKAHLTTSWEVQWPDAHEGRLSMAEETPLTIDYSGKLTQ